MRVLKWIATLITGFIVLTGLAIALVFFWPVNFQTIENTTSAARTLSYADAKAGFAKIEAHEAELPLDPRCTSQLLDHGTKTQKVVVLFHGLSNCPVQWDELAQALYNKGYNVLIPRMKGHGEADRMTLALANLTAADLVTLGDNSIALASGLGDTITIVGHSTGGTIALWAAQNRGDVDKIIAVSPFPGPYVVPNWAMTAATNLFLALPNQMMWWDAKAKDRPSAMDYAYPRFATRALGEIMRLGQYVTAQSQTIAPKNTHINFLLNESDEAVNNKFTLEIADNWRAHGVETTVTTLPKSDHLPHDIIDPRQEQGDIQKVYPLLMAIIAD